MAPVLLILIMLLVQFLFSLRHQHHLNLWPFIYLIVPLYQLIVEEVQITLSPNGISYYNYWGYLFRLDKPKTIPYTDITGILINHQGTKNTTYEIKALLFKPSLYSNKDALTAHLLQHVAADKLTVAPPPVVHFEINSGRRPPKVALAGGLLGLIVVCVAATAIHQLHPAFFPASRYLIVMAPLTLGLTYLWVKADGKASPFKASCIAAILPAIALAFAGSTLNQWLTEKYGTTTAVEFRYADYYDGCQSFIAVNAPYIRLHTDDNGVHICARHDGYNAKLQLGATYRINLQRGFLNEISFTDSAFFDAVMTQPAPVKPVDFIAPKPVNSVTPKPSKDEPD
jgi:hypothetical protein